MGREFFLNPYDNNGLIRLAECPVCGKTFVLHTESIYKLDTPKGRRYYCGYNCYRKVYKEMYGEQERKEKEKIKKELEGR